MTIEYKYFSIEDFNCSETGENNMSVDFIMDLDELRERCGFPFIITSGYRSVKHSREAHKPSGGTHTKGIAADIKVSGGAQRYKVIQEALMMGFTGIGVANTFIHVDERTTTPVIWNY